MQGQPVLQAGFVAHEQGFEAIEPSVESLSNQPPIQLRVEHRIIVGLPIGRVSVAGDVGFDASGSICLAQCIRVEGFTGV